MEGVTMDGQRSFAPEPKNAATILCADCGAPVDGTLSGAFCYDCIKLKTDVTGGIPREAILLMCRDCDRWLSPPTTWVVAHPESRELLALCLRKLRGLNKLRIIDASFIWTEPHSRRIKVKITVQSEINEGAIMQQSFEVEFTQNYNQCPDCAKSYTHNTWRASVQVRQKVPHKRTFLYLEQLILKHGAHKDTINIKEVHDGIDFFFAQRNHAVAFCDFLKAVIPVNIKRSEELISHDIHTSTKNYKFSFSCEIVPICKDDLVVLPIPLAKKLGNVSPLTLCTRIGTSVQLLDPSTLQTADVATDIYWRTPFRPLADVQELTEFIVLDIEPLGKQVGRHFLAEATVARASDMGVNDTTYYCRTHLGGILHVGDSVMGYLLANTNFNNELFDVLESNNKYSSAIPDVMLVKTEELLRHLTTTGAAASMLPRLQRLHFSISRASRSDSVCVKRLQALVRLSSTKIMADNQNDNTSPVATFAAGCFWGVELAFQRVHGVTKTTVGYTNGHTENPTYKEVCTDKTGHAEAIRIEYDPKVVTYGELLNLFWSIHDPTSLNRQKGDIGTQYRSGIFYHNEEQKKEATASLEEQQKTRENKIVTEITAAGTFYSAEEYHQQYLEKGGQCADKGCGEEIRCYG